MKQRKHIIERATRAIIDLRAISYNVAEIIVKNSGNKRIPLVFSIIAPDQISLELDEKFMLIEPNSVQRFYIPFNVAKRLDRGKTYRLSLVLNVNNHWEIPINLPR